MLEGGVPRVLHARVRKRLEVKGMRFTLVQKSERAQKSVPKWEEMWGHPRWSNEGGNPKT